MALCQVHWFSQVLRKQVGMYVILPDVGTPPFATFYLLHGLSDDYTIWQRRTRIEEHVRQLPLIVVMPDGFRGFYTNNNQGPDYATYTAEELPAFIERNFPARADRNGRCIGGLSMGGYGALRIGLGYSDRYASINSHSGALMVGQRMAASDRRDPEFERVFGPDPVGTNHDLVHLAGRAKAAGSPPAIRIDCGREDFLIQENRDYHAALEQLGIAHEYAEFPGAHTWDYWDVHVQEALRFHARAMGIV